MRLLFALGLLQRGELAFGQPGLASSDLGFERLEPFLHRLKVIMALPDPAHPGRRNFEWPEFAKLVGDADLRHKLRPVQRESSTMIAWANIGRRAVLSRSVCAASALAAPIYAAGVVKLLVKR